MKTAEASAVREHPIMFKGPMVRAILAGRKTQTRRVVKNSARGADRIIWISKEVGRLWPGGRDEPYEGWAAQVDKLNGLHLPLTCPYGAAGDRLWVREALRWHDKWIHYDADDAPVKSIRQVGFISNYIPALLMHRDYCRITLENADVRAQRLHDITREDVRAEGIPETFGEIPGWVEERFPGMPGHDWDNLNWAQQWRICWDSINGKKSPWSSNPLVWAITLKVVSGGAR